MWKFTKKNEKQGKNDSKNKNATDTGKAYYKGKLV